MLTPAQLNEKPAGSLPVHPGGSLGRKQGEQHRLKGMISGKQPGTPAPPGPGPPVGSAHWLGLNRPVDAAGRRESPIPLKSLSKHDVCFLLQEAESWTQAALVLGSGHFQCHLVPPATTRSSPGAQGCSEGPTQPPKPDAVLSHLPVGLGCSEEFRDLGEHSFKEASKKGGRRAGF